MLGEVNQTHIPLIPKIDNPSRANQFRPISLTNFNYKLISKILANSLKPLLYKIISLNQYAFLQGRSIHDNSIFAYEIFHIMKQKKDWQPPLQGSQKLNFDVAIKGKVPLWQPAQKGFPQLKFLLGRPMLPPWQLI